MLRWGVAAIVVAWSLVLAAWLTLHWGILPRLDHWRPEIEQRASRVLGVPVRIGRIEVQSSGWVPALQLHDVVLTDPRQREALRLPRVAAAVSVRSLASLRLRFEQLLIEGAELDVRRDTSGALWVAGLPIGRQGGGDDGLADWFFEQHEFAIRHGRLRWTDEQRGAAPLALSDVDLVVRNGLRHHALRLDATPPPAWGQRFSLRARFTAPLLARAGDWQRWSGTAYAELPQADVGALGRYVSLPFELQQGRGAVRAWVGIERGAARSADVDLALQALQLRLLREGDPLALADLQGRLSVRDEGDGRGTLAWSGLGFRAGGAAWPRGSGQLAWQQRPGEPLRGGRVQADVLDLGVLAALAERLPLGQALHGLLRELAPRGLARALSLQWEGAADHPAHYSLRTQLEGLALAAGASDGPDHPGRPGVQNARLTLDASDQGGSASLRIDDGALEFPGVFEQPRVPLDRLAANVAWRVTPVRGEPPAIEVQVKDARFANADTEGEFSSGWHTGSTGADGKGRRFPGVLELSGRFMQGQAAAVARYLPLSVPADTRRYVAEAIQAGRVETANFRVRGDLARFPFSHGREGEFRVAARLSAVQMAYVPGEHGQPARWPAFEQLAGELVFDRDAMQIRNARTRVLGYELTQVDGGIAHLGEQPTLVLDGRGRGPLAELLRFVAASPVGGWIDHALQPATGTGASELALALQLPLHDMDHAGVKGSVTLPGNDVRLQPALPLFANTRARVQFQRQGYAIAPGASARVLGGEMRFEGGTQADGSQRFTAQGMLSADGLRQFHELPAVARAASVLSGQTPYRLQLGWAKGQPEWQFSSPLTGLALELPAPLRKPADAPWPLRVSLRPAEAPAGAAPRDQLRIELADVLQAQYLRELPADGEPRVLRGAVGVGEPMPGMQPGVVAQLNLGRVDVDAWQAALASLGAAGTAGSSAAASDAGYMPHQLGVKAQELQAAGRRLTRVSATLSAPDAATWRASVNAEQMSGGLEYRSSAAGGRVVARLARLALPAGEADGVRNWLDQPASAHVPALDVVVDDFQLGGRSLGKLEVEATHSEAPGGGDWKLSKLAVATPDARLDATGAWGAADGAGRRRMRMDFKLDIADSGALLQRLHVADTVQGGHGVLQGRIAWPGSPFEPDPARMDGQLHLALEKGRFLKAGPGAGRLLSVLSLQSLPRRLALDFRDLFQEGFAFDRLDGDVQVAGGIASSNNLRMRGLQAAVLMEGRADLGAETQDLRVIVVPEINAGTASLAYAAIHPAIGLGTFVAQMFLRKPLMAAGTREFHVSGSWDDPKVERVQRNATDPLPDTDVPATASAAASAPR